MRAAWSTHGTATRYDRKNHATTRHDLPADVLALVREYKRLQMQAYRCRTVPAGQLLPEDGIVDRIAIEIAVQGDRAVGLTQRERVLAVWLMEHQGLSQRVMESRLKLPDHTVYYLRQSAMRISEAVFEELIAV